jgi:CelD/BcsL family acetyltransferase involved in cellulose biosynthesis
VILETCLSLDDLRWTSFVQHCPDATAFHHPAWARLIAECYGYRTFALALIDDNGQIVAGMPVVEARRPLSGRRWISFPFSDYCPPLLRDGTYLAALTDGLVRQKEVGILSLEVRSALLEQSRVHLYSHAVIHTLALSPDPDTVFRIFKRTQVQQGIKKAESDGVTVRRASSLTDLDVFYSLHAQTRRRVGTPVQPRRYFELLWKRLIEPGLGFILLAYHGEAPLAGAVFLAWNGTVIYKYSASDPASWRLRPNNLVLWKAIKWACENGYHTFDFGRTDLTDKGLRNFKNGWGTREEPLVYSIIADRPPKPMSGRLSRWMSAVIRRSPPVVCRFLGELFYKYAA